MSLADRLQQAKPAMHGLPCPVATLLGQLEERDRVQLLDALEVPVGAPGRLPTTAIARALQDSGHPIHYKGIERHRIRQCRCFTGST